MFASMVILATLYSVSPPVEVLQGNRDVTLHKVGAGAVAFVITPDENTIVTGGVDRSIRIWAVSDGKLRSMTAHHSCDILTLGISANGRVLASGHSDGSVLMWDLESLKVVSRFVEHSGAVRALSFSPDGQTLASAGDDGSVVLWNTLTNLQHRKLEGHKVRITQLAYAPDKDVLVSASIDGVVKAWDARKGKELSSLKERGQALALAFSPNGKSIAIGTGGDVSFLEENAKVSFRDVFTKMTMPGRILVWDWANGVVTHSHELQVGQVSSISYSPDGQKLAYGTIRWKIGEFVFDMRQERGEIAIWDPFLKSFETPTMQPSQGVVSIKHSKNGKWIAFLDTNGPVKIMRWSK